MRKITVDAAETVNPKIAQLMAWAAADEDFSSSFCDYLRAMKNDPEQIQTAYGVLQNELIRMTDGAASDDTLHSYFVVLAENNHGCSRLLERLGACEPRGRA